VADAEQRVAAYRYDGLFRRVSKQVGQQGEGVVYHSDEHGTGIPAGDRHGHCFWGGMAVSPGGMGVSPGGVGVSPANWRLVELTDHADGDPYDYADAAVLGQFVYGTQYIDEPLGYDRNTDVTLDLATLGQGQAGENAGNDCLGSGGTVTTAVSCARRRYYQPLQQLSTIGRTICSRSRHR